jgi:hypothetical protein
MNKILHHIVAKIVGEQRESLSETALNLLPRTDAVRTDPVIRGTQGPKPRFTNKENDFFSRLFQDLISGRSAFKGPEHFQALLTFLFSNAESIKPFKYGVVHNKEDREFLIYIYRLIKNYKLSR